MFAWFDLLALGRLKARRNLSTALQSWGRGEPTETSGLNLWGADEPDQRRVGSWKHWSWGIWRTRAQLRLFDARREEETCCEQNFKAMRMANAETKKNIRRFLSLARTWTRLVKGGIFGDWCKEGGAVWKRDVGDAKNTSLLKLGTLGDSLQSSSSLRSSAKKKWFLLQTLQPEKVSGSWGGASQVEASSGEFRVHHILFLIDHFILLAAASQEALGPRKEPAGLLPGSDDRPADVLLRDFNGLRISEFTQNFWVFSFYIADFWQTFWVIWENGSNWSNSRLKMSIFALGRLKNHNVPHLHLILQCSCH